MISLLISPLLVLLGILGVPVSPLHDVAPYKPGPGPWRVEILEETWRDDARIKDGKAREVPVRVYLPRSDDPAPATERLPVVVFSHGMGGSRDGYEYIGRHLASHGYIMVHPQHAGSDTPAIIELAKESRRNGKRPGVAGIIDEGTSDPDNLVDRPLDVAFVLDRIKGHATLGPLADMERVAVAGHSFGSYTALASAGMRVELPESHKGPVRSFRDARIKAAIAMSPQGPGVMGIRADAWEPITMPVLLITGSKDMGQGDRAVAWRLTPFDKIASKNTLLLFIDGATHMTFSGAEGQRGLLGAGPRRTVERHTGFVEQVCTAFLDAHLRGDSAARAWLDAKAIEALSERECELRSKGSPAPKGQ
jgi:predicted dienelactone hydrolase